MINELNTLPTTLRRSDMENGEFKRMLKKFTCLGVAETERRLIDDFVYSAPYKKVYLLTNFRSCYVRPLNDCE